MYSITNIIVDKLAEENRLADTEIMKMRYILKALGSEFVKTMLFVAIFGFLGVLVPFLLVMLLIIPARVLTGGLHLNTNVGCFLVSLSFFLLSVILLPQAQLSTFTYQTILLTSTACIWLCPLAPSSKRPIVRIEKYLFNKYFSILYTSVYAILFLIVFRDPFLIKCGIWALFLQALQLLLLNVFHIIRR